MLPEAKADSMKSKILIAVMLVAAVALSGCTETPQQPQQPGIESQEQVQEVVTNVTDSFGDIQETLVDIDKTFDIEKTAGA